MIKSMTGFGRGQHSAGGRDITVEIKAVNHRYFEFSVRSPRSCNFMDDRLKQLVQAQVARGKTEMSVSIVSTEGTRASVTVNEQLASSYVQALRAFGESCGIADDLTLSSVARFGEIFNVDKATDDEEELWQEVLSAASEALENFVAMRCTEGEKLRQDVLSRLDVIEGYLALIEQRSPETVKAYRERLYAKMCEVLGDSKVDEQRILTEAAIYAERVAVDEETVRLRSHLEQLRAILAQDEPAGRKLDFLVQELNRETNTIGSKAQNLEIARVVVDIKSEIEKIREQIQNIE